MHALGEGAGPGLHHLRASDPSARAAALAEELGGRVCRTAAELDAALAEAVVPVPVDDAAIRDLARTARRWASLSQAADRTRRRVVAAAGQRLAPGALAVHPETVRDRARRLEAARARLLDAEQALAAHVTAAPVPGGRATDAPVVDDHPSGAAAPPSGEHVGSWLRARRNQALGAMLASFGIATILLASSALPLWAALLVPFLASLWALRHLRPVAPTPSDDDGSSRLAQVGAYTDELFGARRAAQEHEARRARLAAARSGAEEELRLADKAWTDLAGPGVDPGAVEDVVRRFDPGLGGAEDLVGESASVRATEAALGRLVERWAAGWTALGLPVPPIGEGEAAVRAVAAGPTHAIVLVGEVAARAEEVAARVPTAPVVVVEAEGPGPDPAS